MFLALGFIALLVGQTLSASCSSNEYCPNGWTVLRREDQSPHTCDPMKYQSKCPKPHQCVHSKCGMSFCCANPVKMSQWKRQKEVEEEMAESDDEL